MSSEAFDGPLQNIERSINTSIDVLLVTETKIVPNHLVQNTAFYSLLQT